MNTPARAGLSNGLSTRLVPEALLRPSTSRLVLGGCYALDVAVRHCVTSLVANPMGTGRKSGAILATVRYSAGTSERLRTR